MDEPDMNWVGSRPTSIATCSPIVDPEQSMRLSFIFAFS